MWPLISPLGAYGYATQPINPMPTNSVLPQNMSQFSAYYNPNQAYGQQYGGYQYYPSVPLIPQSTQTSAVSPYLSQSTVGSDVFAEPQPNQTFAIRTTQSFPSPNQRPQTLTTIQTTAYIPLNANSFNNFEDEKWLQLLNSSQKQVLDQLNKETEAFEQQFSNWEKDFENWKQTNRTHPDSTAYQLYVNQWQEWRQKLLERQKQMKDLRTRTLQQLYAQVKPQIHQISSQPPPPPPIRSEVPPPPPPIPSEKRESNPPPPSEPHPNQQKRAQNNRNENNLSVNSAEMQTNSQKEVKTSEQNSKDIEIIEIDCESKVSDETNNAINADPNAVSKAAEALLFIQKQQELLKSLENLKNVSTNDNKNDKNSDESELQIIEPKGFDVKDIVTKMKAIRPPESPIESNKLLSTLPSLQGIVLHPKPQNDNKQQKDSNRESFDRDFGDSDNRPSFAQNFMNSFQGMPTRPRFQSSPTVNQPFRPHLPNDPIHSRPPMPPNSTNINSNFMQLSDDRWKSSNPSTSREGRHYYRTNDNQLNAGQPNSVGKYSAQTIDYNHRHENKDLNLRIDPSIEKQPYIPPKQMTTPLTNNFYNQNNNQMNPSLNRELFDDFQKPINNSNPLEMTAIEEELTFRDKRYFTHPKSRIVAIDDLLKPPTRDFRPENIVIILRGLPGSGKTFVAKLIKEKELEFGRSAPRILSIDDYFMSEVERQIKIPETGKTVKTKEYVYEYEREMESCYRASLLKTYKKTVDDRLFSFIIIDAVNELIADIEDFYSYAIKNDFTVYVIEMVSNDPLVCHKNNIHNRTLEDIKLVHKKWQTLPEFMLRLDIRSLLQNASIKNVEMEDNPSESGETLKRKAETESESSNKELKTLRDSEHSFNGETPVSRWERIEASESKLDKLDSFRMKTKPTIEEYLQVTDDYDLRLKDKKKRVRWADIEEQKKQDHMRQRGFVVGLNWHQYMDPQHPQRVLTETKYF